jgi:hypothetical protein
MEVTTPFTTCAYFLPARQGFSFLWRDVHGKYKFEREEEGALTIIKQLKT